jgi:hypothetical protein
MKEMFEKIKHSFFSILMPGFFIVVMLLNIIVSTVGIDTIMKIPFDLMNPGIMATTETETETIEKEITDQNRTLPVEKLPIKNATKVSTVTREIAEDFSKSIFDWGIAGGLFILFCFSYLVGSIIRAIAVDVFDRNVPFPLFSRSYWNEIIRKSRFPYPVMLFALQAQMDHKSGMKEILDEISHGVREKYASIITLQRTISVIIKVIARCSNDPSLDQRGKKSMMTRLEKLLSAYKKDLKREYKEGKAEMKEGNSILHNRFNYCKMYLCHTSFSLFGFIREYEERVRLFAGMCWAGLIGGVANGLSLIIMAVTGYSGLRVMTVILLCLSVLLFVIFFSRIRPTRASEARRVYLGYAMVKAGEENKNK